MREKTIETTRYMHLEPDVPLHTKTPLSHPRKRCVRIRHLPSETGRLFSGPEKREPPIYCGPLARGCGGI